MVKISSTTVRATARAVKPYPRRRSGAVFSSRATAAELAVRADEDGLRACVRARGFPRPGPALGREVGLRPDGTYPASNRGKAEAPAYRAASSRSSSMRSSWLYLATRSVRAGAPDLICPQLVATARSAIVVSSV